MALHLEILKNLSGYSLAKYATWFYYKSDNLLFDAGEGVSIAMRNKIYAIERIFISHGHGDHIAGLPGFLSSRASSMGDQNKPLSIYFPKKERNVLKLRAYIEEALGWLPFSISWTELTCGTRIELGRNRILEAFDSKHGASSSLGYKIIECRKRLRENYRLLSGKELAKVIKKKGKDDICEHYERILLCYSGDTMPLTPKIVKDAEVLIHDCTFLKAQDREEKTHASLEEVLKLALKAKVSALGLFHFSTRYRYREIVKAIQNEIHNNNVSFPVFYLLPYSSPLWFKQIIPEEIIENGKAKQKHKNE